MTNNILATFVRRRFENSGTDQAPDYYVYEFTNIEDGDGKKYKDKWIKETKLMQAVTFQKGKRYQLTLSEKLYSMDSINLPYPTEIIWDDNFKVIKYGGRIITHDIKKGKYFDLSNSKEVDNKFKPISGGKLFDGTDRYNKSASNKFNKGALTEDLLIKMNSRGVYFFVHYCDPQDKRKSRGYSCGYSKEEKKGNYVLIQEETQAAIDKDLEFIKRNFVTKSIEKHFKITTEILISKKIKK